MMHKGCDLPDAFIGIEGFQLHMKPVENIIEKLLIGHFHSHSQAVHPPNGNIEMPAGKLLAEFFDESAILSKAGCRSGRDLGTVERRRDAQCLVAIGIIVPSDRTDQADAVDNHRFVIKDGKTGIGGNCGDYLFVPLDGIFSRKAPEAMISRNDEFSSGKVREQSQAIPQGLVFRPCSVSDEHERIGIGPAYTFGKGFDGRSAPSYVVVQVGCYENPHQRFAFGNFDAGRVRMYTATSLPNPAGGEKTGLTAETLTPDWITLFPVAQSIQVRV